MPVAEFVKPGLYKDSLTLMRLTETLAGRDNVQRAVLLMGTPANKEMLAASKLLGGTLAAAGPDDLMVVIETKDANGVESLSRELDRLLAGDLPVAGDGSARPMPPRSLAAALARTPDANLALISVPGPYAAAEATKALRAGLNVFLFSDNVPLEAERSIKRLAERKGLLVMGPDCGTAIVQGIPLGFANAVRRGPIGVIGASGTGMQEVTCQIHRLGGGISHALGTGGRDLQDGVGGITARAALRLLADDPQTKVVLLLSKPPSPSVAAEIADALARLGKPGVLLFLGAAAPGGSGSVRWAEDLEAAARAALAAAGVGVRPEHQEELALAQAEQARHRGQARYLRGLYSGGTYAYEAQLVWRRAGLEVRSNAPLERRLALANPHKSIGHAAIDLGEDSFTVGRLHPMIDPSSRIERLLEEARDPEAGVIVLDIVLGFGAHPDPAGALAPAIRAAKASAAVEGRHLTVIAFLCGTEGDPQGYGRQETSLREAGALLASGSTQAARLAALCLGKSAARTP